MEQGLRLHRRCGKAFLKEGDQAHQSCLAELPNVRQLAKRRLEPKLKPDLWHKDQSHIHARREKRRRLDCRQVS